MNRGYHDLRASEDNIMQIRNYFPGALTMAPDELAAALRLLPFSLGLVD